MGRPWRGRIPGWVARYAEMGVDASAPDEVRVRTTLLTLSATLMASLAFVWVGTYAALGLWTSAAIPFAFQVATALSIAVFARTGRLRWFRTTQLAMWMALPFALQWSLGGFENSSVVGLWAIIAPLGALLLTSGRQARAWFGAFVVLVVVSGAIDHHLASSAPHVPDGVDVTFFVLNVAAVATTAFVIVQYFVEANERERARSERLLLNVLPAAVAAQLKRDDGVIAEAHAEVTVLFADIVGFTPLAERLPADEVVALLDQVFAAWDALAARLELEKIKTIGDAYMVASGVPLGRHDHAEAVAEMALAMRTELARIATEIGLPLELRIGIDSGPVVAGVIGRAKFSYDLWGDTVNTASRMEAHAPRGAIQVTERAAARLDGRYELQSRGTVEIKGKGPMATHLLVARRS